MTDRSTPTGDPLRRLINGYQLSQAIYVAVTLGVPQALEDGPRTADELARTVNANSESLYRLLRALAAAGLFEEQPERSFGLTPLGARLTPQADRSLSDWAAFVGRPYHWQSWSNMLHTVRTGENAFKFTHGMDVWEYRHLHAAEGAVFDAAMVAQTRAVNEALLDAYDFGRYQSIVDVGGGRGALLASILKRHPGSRGVLFDSPHVVDGAGPFLQAEGVAERCELVGGDFFAAVPSDCDAYLLKSIVHDWLDPEATRILQVCRQAMGAGGRVVIIERIVGPANEDLDTKLSDLQMLVNAGGRERTVREFGQIVEAAGMLVAGVTPTGSGFSLIDAVPPR